MYKGQHKQTFFDCAICGNPFPATPLQIEKGKKYCSVKCQGKAFEKRIEKSCLGCGKPFAIRPCEAKKQFCSSACYSNSIMRPPVERFWDKVDKNGPIPKHCPELGSCWNWLACTDPFGYGVLMIPRPKKHRVCAHRFSYELHIGPIPGGMLVCHHCDNPPCTNPLHLFLGTYLDNNRDMYAKGRDANQYTYKK